MLADSKVSVLLTESSLSGVIPLQNQCRLVLLDQDWPSISQESRQNQPSLCTPDTAAYAIYTSGSTGSPKAVINTHRGLRNHLLWRQKQYPLGAADSVLQRISISFDPSLWEIWGPLLAGARIVVAHSVMQDPDSTVREIVAHQITALQNPPSLFRALLNTSDLSSCSSLRYIICGGEALTVDIQEKFFAKLATAELHNLYGPTETAVDVSFWKCQPGEKDGTVAIGKPIGNTEVYVLDGEMELAPVGVVGELYWGERDWRVGIWGRRS